MAYAYTWQHMVKDGNTWQQIAAQGHTWPHIATSAKSLLGLYQHYEDIQCKDSLTTSTHPSYSFCSLLTGAFQCKCTVHIMFGTCVIFTDGLSPILSNDIRTLHHILEEVSSSCSWPDCELEQDWLLPAPRNGRGIVQAAGGLCTDRTGYHLLHLLSPRIQDIPCQHTLYRDTNTSRWAPLPRRSWWRLWSRFWIQSNFRKEDKPGRAAEGDRERYPSIFVIVVHSL